MKGESPRNLHLKGKLKLIFYQCVKFKSNKEQLSIGAKQRRTDKNNYNEANK